MKFLLTILALLLVSVASIPLPDVASEKEVSTELKPDEKPDIITELKSETASVEKTDDIKVMENMKATSNIETSEPKMEKLDEPKKIEQETKKNTEDKVVIIEAKSVVNTEPEIEKKTEKTEEKLEIPVDVKESTVITVTENAMDAVKPIPIKKIESDEIHVMKDKKADNVDSSNESNEKKSENESKEGGQSSESKESTESKENKS